MSWLDANYRKRVAITVYNPLGAASGDVNVSIPKTFSAFWDVIDSSCDSIRVTAADGYTVLNYAVDDGSGGAFDSANKAGRIQIDGMWLPGIGAGELALAWLYFDPTTAPASGAVAVTIASALTGSIELANAADIVAVAIPARPGSTRPANTRSMTTSDQQVIWLDIAPRLHIRRDAFAGRDWFEEPASASLSTIDSSGVVHAFHDMSKSRWVEVSRGGKRRLYLASYWDATGATSGTNYTLIATVDTVAPNNAGLAVRRSLGDVRMGIRVLDVKESAT